VFGCPFSFFYNSFSCSFCFYVTYRIIVLYFVTLNLFEEGDSMEFVDPIRETSTIEHIKKILLSQSKRNFLLFTLGINSALRISDLLRLKIKDVTDSKGKPLERISLREKKTGKTKSFPLTTNSKKAIILYYNDVHPERDSFLFYSFSPNKSISRVQAYRIINAAARMAGINDRIGTHTLRKTFAYHAYKNGYDISIIQKLLNHSSPSTTLRYIGITQDDIDSIYMNLNI